LVKLQTELSRKFDLFYKFTVSLLCEAGGDRRRD
jgi:hypothetical protein